LACSRGFGNIVTIIPRMTADVIAPPTLGRSGDDQHRPGSETLPHNREATVKTARPARNTLLPAKQVTEAPGEQQEAAERRSGRR